MFLDPSLIDFLSNALGPIVIYDGLSLDFDGDFSFDLYYVLLL
jgi:hypothetical protein